jgi:hypothetical protein
MKKLAVLAVVLPLVLAPGCPVHKFEVTMKPAEDGGVHRELTVWTEDGDTINVPGDDVLGAAKGAYGDAGSADGNKQRFGATFAEALPADLVHEGLTNHGFVGMTACPLGRVVTYVERMPGRDDLFALLNGAEQLADTLAKVWAAWARQQPSLQAEPEKLAKLVTFIEHELRDDALNIMLMGWRGVTRGNILEDAKLDDEDESVSRLWRAEFLGGVSYLVERGYFRPAEVALLQEEGGRVALHGVLRRAVNAMGCDEVGPWPAALEQLRDPDAVEAAFEQGLAAIGLTSDELEQRYAPLMPEIFGTSTRGRVVWLDRVQPLETNGAWDEEKRELSWDAQGRQGCETPQLLYAIWAEPDEAFQQQHFGRTMLEGEPLTKYVSWRAALSAAELREWDAFVAGLRPGEDLVTKLEKLRFATPTTMPSTMPSEQPESDLVPGAKLILGR